jgi:hypothetical protein
MEMFKVGGQSVIIIANNSGAIEAYTYKQQLP